MRHRFVITCEHAGNGIPERYAPLFKGEEAWLHSHRGLDIGALPLYSYLIERGLADYSKFATISRVLIELNRSLHHPALFSKITKPLDGKEKKNIIDEYYVPYRTEVEQEIAAMIERGEHVVHIAVHSFTPELNGEVRNTDIGILFDPSSPSEKNIATRWKSIFNRINPSIKVRFNYPYLGKADGFPTYLRKKLPEGMYTGIELEMNQKFPLTDQEAFEGLVWRIGDSISELKKQMNQL